MRLWIDSIEQLQCSKEKEMVSFHHREAGGSHTLHQFYTKEVGEGGGKGRGVKGGWGVEGGWDVEEGVKGGWGVEGGCEGRLGCGGRV